MFAASGSDDQVTLWDLSVEQDEDEVGTKEIHTANGQKVFTFDFYEAIDDTDDLVLVEGRSFSAIIRTSGAVGCEGNPLAPSNSRVRD